MTDTSELAKQILTSAGAAVGCVLAAMIGWGAMAFGMMPLGFALFIWLVAGVIGVAGAVGPYRSAATRTPFLIGAIGNLGSWAFVEFLLHSGFTTVGH
ncbi:MAG TPA: hypothetical protein VGH80_08665 [Xanthomonadaceae bacterium]|jgi:hypothetical protein